MLPIPKAFYDNSTSAVLKRAIEAILIKPDRNSLGKLGVADAKEAAS